MNLIKPQICEIVHKPVSLLAGQHALSVAVLVHFSLHPDGEPQPDAVSPVWDALNPTLHGHGFDEGWPKLQAEYLVLGAAYPPAGHTGQPVSVSVRMGNLSKRLAVFGDRHFNALGGISDPAPFERMPITPATAYGAEGFAANPFGKGAQPVRLKDGSEWHPLPNVELPDALVRSPSSQPGPAGFWAYSPDMPQRARFLGTFDEEWTRTRWPHLPVDTNYTYFQVAPPDQRLPQGFWQGGEPITLQNMHPVHAVLQAQLPALRARLFPAVAVADQEFRIGEVETRLETVYLLPDQLAGVALYRALVEVQDPEARDVVGLCVALEPLDAPAKAPEALAAEFGPQLQSLLGPAVRKPPPARQSPEQEAANAHELLAQLQEQRQSFLGNMAAAGMTEAEILSTLRQNPQTRALALAIEQGTAGGSISGFFDELEQMVKLMDNEGKADDQDQATQDATAARQGRLEVIRRKGAAASCRDLNLPNADLSGLDLSGMDFSGSVLSGASLVGATLKACRFDRAVLTQANFTGADLSGASLAMSSLGQARFEAATLAGASLVQAHADGCRFTDAVLENVDLSMASLSGADLRNTNLSGVSASRTGFSMALLAHANLSGARLLEASFDGADLTEADLSKAICLKTSFSCAKLHKARLQGADLTESSADEGTQATSADLRDAHLDKASWVGVNLSGANLDRVTAEEADFSDAGLSQVSMRRAVAKGAHFDRALLAQANLSLSNFMEGSFTLAQLQGIVMQGCNLYGVNFLETVFDDADLDGSYIERTILAERLGKTQL